MRKYLICVLFIVAMLVPPCFVAAQTGDELSIAAAKTEEARKRANDFEGFSYFPGEWEAAEAEFAAAKEENTLDSYNIATDTFNSIFDLAILLYAQAREDEIMELRNDLVNAGARNTFPEYFTPADEAALAALNQYEAQDYYTARDSAAKAFGMYEVLTSAYAAWLVRQEIRERDFTSYDPDNFNRAGEILNEAIGAYTMGDNVTALEGAEDALLRYHLALSNGWAGYAELQSSLTEDERQTALDLKANIATRDLFLEADASYKTAASLYDSKDYEEAAKQFMYAGALFAVSAANTTEKRDFAAEAITEANQKIQESDEAAQQAEIILRGGRR